MTKPTETLQAALKRITERSKLQRLDEAVARYVPKPRKQTARKAQHERARVAADVGTFGAGALRVVDDGRWKHIDQNGTGPLMPSGVWVITECGHERLSKSNGMAMVALACGATVRRIYFGWGAAAAAPMVVRSTKP